jgi:hypothetical protein
MKRQNILKAGSIVLIVALGMTLLSSTDKHSNAANFKPEVRTVNTQQVIFDDHTLVIESNGVIES